LERKRRGGRGSKGEERVNVSRKTKEGGREQEGRWNRRRRRGKGEERRLEGDEQGRE
jgi:hypothetical protein